MLFITTPSLWHPPENNAFLLLSSINLLIIVLISRTLLHPNSIHLLLCESSSFSPFNHSSVQYFTSETPSSLSTPSFVVLTINHPSVSIHSDRLHPFSHRFDYIHLHKSSFHSVVHPLEMHLVAFLERPFGFAFPENFMPWLRIGYVYFPW